MIVVADLELTDSTPDELEELLVKPAAAARMADLRPPLRPPTPPWLTRESPDPDEQPVRRPRRTVVSEAALIRVQEAAVYKTHLHPRWPKGTPGGKGGEFMEVGQTFKADGKTYQIAHIVKGKVIAHEASGQYHAVETREFDVHDMDGGAKTIAKAEYHAPSAPKGGKSQAANVTVVDPYVDSSTHDAQLTLPETSTLDADEWKRFGKVDQQHYAELQERFGQHKPGAAKAHIDASYQAFQAAVQTMVKSAYQSQYGSSSGYSLSLAAGSHNNPDPVLREKALALQAEHRAAVQWDLYNRTHSPDLFAVHKSNNWSASQWESHAITGENKVFSGLSQSWNYRASFFGSHAIATPLAIRHVLLATQSAQPIPGESHFAHEVEISVPEQMKMDARSITFSVPGHGAKALTPTQNKWLEGVTNQPQGGHIMDLLKDAIQTGASLPIPPAPASITMNGAGGQTWADPPGAAATVLPADKLPGVQGSSIDPATLNTDLPWAHTDENGAPITQTGETAGAKAGQYFMGLKGTLYWIGNDPGNTSGYPFRIHKIENGVFNGENFAYNPDLPGYYLDAHHEEVLSKPDDTPQFKPEEWVPGTEASFLEKFEAGDKFKVNGSVYEVTGPLTTGGMPIVDLETGKPGKINGDYKSVKLVPFDSDLADPAELMKQAPPLSVGSAVMTPEGYGQVAAVDGADVTVDMPGGYQLDFNAAAVSHWQQPLQPKAGQTFPFYDGGEYKKATVTVVKDDGSVQINLAPGKVVIPADEWAAYAQKVFEPEAWSIGADKTKLRYMQPGDKFQGSAGNNTIRPYEVLQVPGAGQVTVRNMDTGEVSTMSRHVSYRKLQAKAPVGSAADGQADLPDSPAAANHTPVSTALHENIDPSGFTSAVKQPLAWAEVGQVVGGKDSPQAVVTAKGEDGSITTAMLDGSGDVTWDAAEAQNQLHFWTPKGDKPAGDLTGGPPQNPTAAFVEVDGSKFTQGSPTKIGEMPGGTLFKTSSKTKGDTVYKLSDDGQWSTNLKTGKSYPTKSGWKAVPLEPAEAPPPPVEGVTAKDVPPGSFIANDSGDVFKTAGDWSVTVVAKGEGSTLTVEVGDTINTGPNPVFHQVRDPNAAGGEGDTWTDSAGVTYAPGESVPFADVEVSSYIVNTSGGPMDGLIFQKVNASDAEAVGMLPSGDAELLHEYHAVGPTPMTPQGNWSMMLSAGAGADSETHVFSAGEPLHMGDGSLIAKGGLYSLYGEPVTAQGSGNAPGTLLVTHEGGTTEVIHPSELSATAPSPSSDELAPSSLKDKPGALFVHKGQTMSVAANQDVAAEDELIAVAPDGGGWLVTPSAGGVKPIPGHGSTSIWSVNEQAIFQGEPVTIAVIQQNPHGEDPGGSVTIEFPNGDWSSVPGSMLQELSQNVKPGDKVQAHWAGGGSLGEPTQVTGHVSQVTAAGVMLHGSTKVYKPHQLDVLKQYPFYEGDKVEHVDGTTGTFTGWEVGPNGKAYATFVGANGDEIAALPDSISLASVPVEDLQGIPLEPKAAADTPLAYEDLTPGDVTTVGTVKIGDHFSLPGTDSMFVLIKAPNSPQGNAWVKPVNPDGSYGTTLTSGWTPDTVVTMQSQIETAEHTVDPDALPDAVVAGGLVGYKSHKGSGGKWSHHQIQSMPEGTIFADLNGHQWKVKQGGASPIISDGEQLYTVDGKLRGKDLNQPAVKQNATLVDHSPPVGWAPQQPAMVPAPEGATLGDLDLQPGDHYQVPHGGTYEVLIKDEDGWIESQYQGGGALGGAAHSYHPPGAPVAKVEATAVPDLAPSAPDQVAPSAAAPPTLYTQPTTAEKLQTGDKFVLAPGSTEVLTVTGKPNGYTAWTHADGLSGGTMIPGYPVYAEPGAPEPPPAPDAPSVQDVDPASVEEIQSPAQMVPVPDVPVDPVVHEGLSLQGFGSRLGPGGVYRHDKLSELQVGQLFTDKSGNDYQLVGHGEGAVTYKNMITGNVYEAPNGLRVKRTALPPDPGPEVKGVLSKLVDKYGGLENVPPGLLDGYESATGEGGTVKYPRLGHLKFGDVFNDSNSNQDYLFVASWLDKALVYTGEGHYVVVPAATRVQRTANFV